MGVKRFAGMPSSPRRAIFVGAEDTNLGKVHATGCQELLLARHPALAIDVRAVERGEGWPDSPSLWPYEGPDPWRQELDSALAQNHIQIAVHAAENLSVEQPPGLLVAAFTRREDPRDALVSRGGEKLMDLPEGAKVGVTSLRQRAQLLAVRPDLEPVGSRHTVEQWLKLVDKKKLHAVIMPLAWLVRVGLGYRITEPLDTERFLPSPGQGGLALVVRERDMANKSLAMGLTHVPSAMAIDGERAFVKALGLDTHMPVAAYGVVEEGRYRLTGELRSLDGARSFRVDRDGFGSVAESVGEELANDLLESGGFDLVRELKEAFGLDEEE